MIRLGAGLWQGGDSTHWVPRAAPATRCVLGAVPMFGALPQRWHSPSAAGFGQVGSGVSVLAQGAAPGLVPWRLCPEGPGALQPKPPELSGVRHVGTGAWISCCSDGSPRSEVLPASLGQQWGRVCAVTPLQGVTLTWGPRGCQTPQFFSPCAFVLPSALSVAAVPEQFPL